MPEENIEFKMLEAKLVGSDTVVFRLEDGTMVKIKVDIDRAGVATNFKNPDGSSHYSINAGLKIGVVPSEKIFHSEVSIAPSTSKRLNNETNLG